VWLRGHILVEDTSGLSAMQMSRLIVAVLGASAWAAPATVAANNLQIRVGQLQEESSLIGSPPSQRLTITQERIGASIQMQLPSIQSRTNNMRVSSQAQALPSISLATSADGKSIHQGDKIIITWQSINSPPGTGVALFPQKALTGHIFAPITTSLPASGSYTWQVPIYVSLPVPCAPDRTGGCIGSMNPGTRYRIVARLYTPSDADFFEYGPTKNHPTYIAAAESGEFIMLTAP
jgi:hypothetical protein